MTPESKALIEFIVGKLAEDAAFSIRTAPSKRTDGTSVLTVFQKTLSGSISLVTLTPKQIDHITEAAKELAP